MRLNQDESKLVSDRVRAHIKEDGAQTALAHKAGLIPQTLSHLLHGRIYWSDEHIDAVARALGISKAELTADLPRALEPREEAIEKSREEFLVRHAVDLKAPDIEAVRSIRFHSLAGLDLVIDDAWWMGLVRLHREARARASARASGARTPRKR